MSRVSHCPYIAPSIYFESIIEKWLSNLRWQILQHWISCPFVRLSSFLPIIDVILFVYIRNNLVFFANAWWPWSKIWMYLERIPSNNTPLVSCHLKSKLQFFLAYYEGSSYFEKHRKNCECCPGHYLTVDHYSSI